MENMNTEQEIDLRELLGIIKRRWWLIGLITFFVVLITIVYSFFIVTPVYQSSTTVMVGSSAANQSGNVDLSELNINRRLAETYGEIVRSRRVANQVIDSMGLNLSTGQLQNKISVAQVRSTEFIEISVSDPNPILAAEIANQLAESFKENIVEIMNVDNVSTLDVAVVPNNPVSPNERLNIAIGFVLGLMIGVFIVFLREYLDNTIKTREDVERHLGLPVIGSVPVMED